MLSYALDGIVKGTASTVKTILPDVIKEIEEASKSCNGISGVPTGFPSIDKVTQGWQKTDMIVVAARPSMGKTAFALSMMINIATQGIPCCLFSCEMSKNQIVKRILSMTSGLNSSLLRGGNLNSDEWQHLDSFVPFCESLPIYIDDESSMSVQSFKTKSKKYVSEYGCKIIVVDYLQLMREKGSQNREQEVANISHSMKDVAKELNVPVIALAQLNRSVESRQGDKRPQLSDLRDSGSIEQDADIVCFIHRPEKYGIDLTEDGISTEGLGQIIIAKNRNGVVCDVNLHFTSDLAKFEEWSDNVTTF
jgi:replicative DNA helicase